MRSKGAFTVRWAAQSGRDGRPVVITSQSIKYVSSTSGTVRPSSGWQTSIPSVSNGNYLWTWVHVVYSDGTQTDWYSVARQGIDGRGIQSSVITYCQKSASVSPESIPESEWGAFPSQLTDGYWLYTRTVITYSDPEHTTSTSYSVSQVGTGAYYAGVEEHYAAGTSDTVSPSGAAEPKTYAPSEQILTTWEQTRPALTSQTPYLWNFEVSYDSRGNKYVTPAICIGNFAKGIDTIVETYAISAYGVAGSGRDYPSDITSWTDEHHDAAPTNAKPYQWNKTVTTYNDGTTETIYHISAVKGADGKGAVYIDLDNENDSILYDGAGNRVGGAAVCNIHLYDNGADVTSGKTFSISDKSSSVTASISGSVLTVTGISSNDGYVIVRCVYNSVSYFARMTIKRLVGTDKYELLCTPSGVTVNTTTGEKSANTIAVEVYKTAQNGSRTKLQILPAGFNLYVNGTVVSYQNYKYSITVGSDAASYTIELKQSGVLIDVETVPVSKTQNGSPGIPGDDGDDAVRYWLLPSADDIVRYRDGSLSVSTINCQKKKQSGTGAVEDASNAVMSYVYTEGGTDHSVNNYTGTNISIGLWWTKIVFVLSVGGHNVDTRTIIIKEVSTGCGENLLNGTNFEDAADEGTTFAPDKDVVDGLDGHKAIRCSRYGASGYSDFFKQCIIRGSDVRVRPSTWYTLSYWAKGTQLITYVYPSLIDTSAVQLLDGVILGSKPSDGACYMTLSQSWVRHTFTFKTKSTLPTENEHVLFRLPAGTHETMICMPKLERGVFSTDWQRSERDKTGAQGLKGCQIRTTEWAAGFDYHNDSGIDGGYIDVVSVTDTSGNFKLYQCRVTHSSSNSNKPSSAGTNTWWTMLNIQTPIYTPLIIALNAVLKFAQTNQLLVQDELQNIIAGLGLGGGQFPLWVGGANSSNAPFRVNKDGSFVSTNADIRGKVEATSGSFDGTLIARSLQQPFVATDNADYTYDVDDPSNLYLTGGGVVDNRITLINNAAFNGRRLHLYWDAKYLRADPAHHIIGRIRCPNKDVIDSSGIMTQKEFYASELISYTAGFAELININGQWVLINVSGSIDYTEA